MKKMALAFLKLFIPPPFPLSPPPLIYYFPLLFCLFSHGFWPCRFGPAFKNFPGCLNQFCPPTRPSPPTGPNCWPPNCFQRPIKGFKNKIICLKTKIAIFFLNPTVGFYITHPRDEEGGKKNVLSFSSSSKWVVSKQIRTEAGRRCGRHGYIVHPPPPSEKTPKKGTK